MTSTWAGESAEKQGYYVNPDNRGAYVRDMESPWKDVPMGLQSEVPIPETVDVANASLEKLDGQGTRKRLEVKPHFEAGSLGCGYAYYESMANRYVLGRQRNVLFCHVPPSGDEESVESAREALLAVIGAAIDALNHLEKNEGPDGWKVDFGKLTG